MSGKTNLHEVLAAEAKVVSKASAIQSEAVDTFKNKHTLFDGQIRIYKPTDDDGMQIPHENVHLRAKVTDKLQYVLNFITEKIDIKCTKEMTNTKAMANLVAAGTDFGEFSAPTLLSLENSFNELRPLLLAIPTRDAAKVWVPNAQENWFETEPLMTNKMEKEKDFKVIVPATIEHAADVREITNLSKVGEWSTTHLSGRISTAEKALLINGFDNMLKEIVKARQRANNTEVTTVTIGKRLLDKIMEPLLASSKSE